MMTAVMTTVIARIVNLFVLAMEMVIRSCKRISCHITRRDFFLGGVSQRWAGVLADLQPSLVMLPPPQMSKR